MEILGLIDVPWWGLLLIALVAIPYLYSTYKQNFFKRLGIPGPKPKLFWGVLSQVSKDGMFYTDIDLVKKHGKCFGVFLGNAPVLMVTDPAMVEQILVKKFSNFVNRSEMIRPPDSWRDSLIASTGDHWKFLRGTISPAFSAAKRKAMSPIFQQCLDKFIECIDSQLQSNDTIDLQKPVSALGMDVISRAAFGMDVDAQNDTDVSPFVKHAQELMNINFGRNPLILLNFLFPEIKAIQSFLGLHIQMGKQDAGNFVQSALKMAIEERRSSKSLDGKDLLTRMINAHENNKPDRDADVTNKYELSFDDYKKRGLNDSEIESNAGAFLLAGQESTSAAITWFAYCVATNLAVQDKLVEEIDAEIGTEQPTHDNTAKLPYLNMVLSETLRLYSPALRVVRDTKEDTEICGVRIPKGTDVTIPIHGLHRLPEYWPDPEKFDPERFAPENTITPFTYMPFAAGPRNCVGMSFALMEIKMTAVKILQNYRIYPSEKTEYPPKVAMSITVKPVNGMWLRLEKR